MKDNKKMKVLLVEDDRDLLAQAAAYLRDAGYEVLEAATQREAEALLKPGAFQAAVVGLMLENADSGFILSHRIKKVDAGVPVILVTSVTKETGLMFDKAQDHKGWIKADVIINKELRLEQLDGELRRLTAVKA